MRSSGNPGSDPPCPLPGAAVVGRLRAPVNAGPARDTAWPSWFLLLLEVQAPPPWVWRSIHRPLSENTPFFHLPTPRAFLAVTISVALKRIKKLWAFFLTSTLGGQRACFYVAHCSLTAIREKKHPVHGLYWICKLLILFFNTTCIYHQPWEVGRGTLYLCNKTFARFYLCWAKDTFIRRRRSSSFTDLTWCILRQRVMESKDNLKLRWM